MIVVATEDFEVYHGVVTELRERDARFTTIEPDEGLPEGTTAVVTAVGDDLDAGLPETVADPDDPRRAVDRALAAVRAEGGRTIVGVDPGKRPGIVVCAGEVIVEAFHVPLGDAVSTIREAVADAVDPVVRVGDGARIQGARIVNELEGVRVELVDETGTTPALGAGARGMGDVLAAVNIARIEGEVVEERIVEPTAGELQTIKDRSRERSEGNRAIDADLARRVADGELTIEEALDVHREE